MLNFVHGHPLLRTAHSDKRRFGNIIVKTVYIRVSMVKNIMTLTVVQ